MNFDPTCNFTRYITFSLKSSISCQNKINIYSNSTKQLIKCESKLLFSKAES